MKTNIGKLFIKLRKHFPKNNKHHKIFNLSYYLSYLSCYCTNNVGNIIKQRNFKVLSKVNDKNNRKCNCRSNCRLNGECLSQCLVYKELRLQHPTTALLTMELLKGSSKHGITTIQNLSDTVNA